MSWPVVLEWHKSGLGNDTPPDATQGLLICHQTLNQAFSTKLELFMYSFPALLQELMQLSLFCVAMTMNTVWSLH